LISKRALELCEYQIIDSKIFERKKKDFTCQANFCPLVDRPGGGTLDIKFN